MKMSDVFIKPTDWTKVNRGLFSRWDFKVERTNNDSKWPKTFVHPEEVLSIIYIYIYNKFYVSNLLGGLYSFFYFILCKALRK